MRQIESRDVNYPMDHRGPVVAFLVHAVVLLMGLPCRVTSPVLNCHRNRYSNHLLFVRVMGFSIWWHKSNPRDANYPVDHRGPAVAFLVHAVVLLMGLPCRVTSPVLNYHRNRYSNHLQSSIKYRPGCSYYHYYHHHQFLCLSSTEKEDLWLDATKFSALASAMFHVCTIERIWSQRFFGIVRSSSESFDILL